MWREHCWGPKEVCEVVWISGSQESCQQQHWRPSKNRYVLTVLGGHCTHEDNANNCSHFATPLHVHINEEDLTLLLTCSHTHSLTYTLALFPTLSHYLSVLCQENPGLSVGFNRLLLSAVRDVPFRSTVGWNVITLVCFSISRSHSLTLSRSLRSLRSLGSLRHLAPRSAGSTWCGWVFFMCDSGLAWLCSACLRSYMGWDVTKPTGYFLLPL